ncbi:MAG: 1,4-dihydroxy-6-naphtoate synthase [Bacteroidia bacterium]|nr:1,4-dihydroxy-6-naphtoate synthase [Bacteroidia bacterium]
MKLTLGFSPCPNDTFIFDALVNKRIDTEGLEFDVQLGDVETLNTKAFKAELDITKLSYHAFAYMTGNYQLLRSGSALGKNCGPILIAKPDLQPPTSNLRHFTSHISNLNIAIPGKYTTANFLLGIALPDAKNKTEMVFSEIENAVLQNKVDAGLIIHENRFTYQSKGLKKLIDLGEFWETTTGLPIPLGGIAIRKNIPSEVKLKVEKLIRKSIEYAFANPDASKEYVRCHSQEMEPSVIQSHIDLYVNNYSINLGAEGEKAVKEMYAIGKEKGIIPEMPASIFVY